MTLATFAAGALLLADAIRGGWPERGVLMLYAVVLGLFVGPSIGKKKTGETP